MSSILSPAATVTPVSGLCQCGCGQRTRLAKHTDHRVGVVKGQPLRYLPGHQSRKSTVEYIEDHDSGCWVWQLNRENTTGYGRVLHEQLAHRVYYERHVGPIPDDLVLDHLCRNRACVNPDHLEPVTPAENARRSPLLTKLTKDDVRRIRRLLDQGRTQVSIAIRVRCLAIVDLGHQVRQEYGRTSVLGWHMTVTFPTSPGRIPMGQPLEARPCKCGDQRMPDGFNCAKCGFFEGHTIRATWAAAAQRMASRSTQPEKLPGRGLKRVAT